MRPHLALAMLASFVVIALAGCIGSPGADPAAEVQDRIGLERVGTDHPAFTDMQAREFDVVTDPDDPDNVTMGFMIPKPHLADLFWSGLARSHDGGETWDVRRFCGDPEVQGERPDAAGCPFAGAAGVGDPVVLRLQDGTVLYVGVMLRADSVVLFAARFPPGAMEPESVHVVARSGYNFVDGAHALPTPYAVYYNGKANLLLDRDGETIHLVWAVNLLAGEAGASNVALPMWTTSTDGGRTWSTPVGLSDHSFGDPDGPFAVGVDAFQTRDGKLHAIWWDGRTNAIYQVTSEDGAETFTSPRKIADVPARPENAPVNFGNLTRPWVGVDRSGGPRDGHAYILFDDLRNGHRDEFLIRSTDDAASWSQPVRVSHASAPPRNETHGRLLVEETGAISVLYSSFEGEDDHSRNHAYLARSTDGGRTFDHLRLSSAPSPLRNIGDYNDLWRDGDEIVAVWEDGREGSETTRWAFTARASTG